MRAARWERLSVGLRARLRAVELQYLPRLIKSCPLGKWLGNTEGCATGEVGGKVGRNAEGYAPGLFLGLINSCTLGEAQGGVKGLRAIRG